MCGLPMQPTCILAPPSFSGREKRDDPSAEKGAPILPSLFLPFWEEGGGGGRELVSFVPKGEGGKGKKRKEEGEGRKSNNWCVQHLPRKEEGREQKRGRRKEEALSWEGEEKKGSLT